MSSKTIFYFLILFNIKLMENTPIFELQKYGEHSYMGQVYYYLNIEDFEIGDEICIELLFQEQYEFYTHYNEILGRLQSDDLDLLSFLSMVFIPSLQSTIVETSSTFYFIIELKTKSKYLLLGTSYFLDKVSHYTIRHINFTLHELPQFTEKIVKGENYLFLNISNFELGDKVYLEISFKNYLSRPKIPLGIYLSNNNTFFSLQKIDFIYSNNYHNKSLDYTFDFEINLIQSSKYLIICTPNLKEMIYEDISINHTKGKNINILLYILIPLFIIIVVAIIIIIIKRRRKKNKSEETTYFLEHDKQNESQNEPPPPFVTPNDTPRPINYSATSY